MKCQICKNKTTWNESFGHDNFIVCPQCYQSIKTKFGKNDFKTMNIIFALGDIRSENQKKTTNPQGLVCPGGDR